MSRNRNPITALTATCALLLVNALALPGMAGAAIVTTADGDGADTMIAKRSNDGGTTIYETDTNYGATGRIGVRTYDHGAPRFEAVFLRFDVSGYISGSFTGDSTLGLTKWRDSESGLDFLIYGLNDGLDNWTEGDKDGAFGTGTDLTFSNAPGIDQSASFPPNPATNMIDTSETSLIDSWNGFTGNKGDELTFASSDLTTFLSNDSDGLVTLLLLRDYTTSTAAFDDFASSEATSLDSGSPTGNAGDFAPSLTFDAIVIPEPGSILLLALGSLALFRRPRRR